MPVRKNQRIKIHLLIKRYAQREKKHGQLRRITERVIKEKKHGRAENC